MSRATSKSRGVTAKQVRDLLAQTPPPEPDPELAELAAARAYRLADGRALVVAEDGGGRLHESWAALVALLRGVDARTPISPFGALLPQGRRFADQAAALAAEFATAHGLPSAADRAGRPDPAAGGAGGASDAPSPPDLDGVVRALGAPACRKPPVFGQLVAYVGEVLIAARGGGWEMRLTSDGTVWEPWVVDGSGRQIAPFGVVYKELAEWGPSSSLTGVVSGSLRPLR